MLLNFDKEGVDVSLEGVGSLIETKGGFFLVNNILVSVLLIYIKLLNNGVKSVNLIRRNMG